MYLITKFNLNSHSFGDYYISREMGHTMCRSMVDIQSLTAEIR